MKQGFKLGGKAGTKRIQVNCNLGKQKEVVALIDDPGFIEAKKYYNHMEKYREKNREIVLG